MSRIEDDLLLGFAKQRMRGVQLEGEPLRDDVSLGLEMPKMKYMRVIDELRAAPDEGMNDNEFRFVDLNPGDYIDEVFGGLRSGEDDPTGPRPRRFQRATIRPQRRVSRGLPEFGQGGRPAAQFSKPTIKLTTLYDDDFDEDDIEDLEGDEARELFDGSDLRPRDLVDHLGQCFLVGTAFEFDEMEHESNAMAYAGDDDNQLYRWRRLHGLDSLCRNVCAQFFWRSTPGP